MRDGYCKDTALAHMLQCLFFWKATFDVVLTARHIPGIENRATDSLSRNNLPLFFSILPQTHPDPDLVPEGVIFHLEGLARDFVDDSLAPSTKWVYLTGQKRYLNFCSVYKLNPFLLAEDQLCTFVAHLTEGLQALFIKGYLSAIRRMQIVQGMGDPFAVSWPLLEYTLRGIKLRLAKRPDTWAKHHLPVTPDILRMLKTTWENTVTARSV